MPRGVPSISDGSNDKPAKTWSPSNELALIINSVAQQLVSEYRRAEVVASTNFLSFNLSGSVIPSDAPAHGDSPRSTNGGSRPTNNTPDTVSSGGSKRPRKRGRYDNDGNGGKSNGNGNDPNQPPPKKSRTEACEAGPKMLACPFWKNDPEKFKQCFHLKLTEIKRVKQHLIRKHTPKHYCNRCLVVFPSDESLENHLKHLSCTRGESAKLEGISYEQRMKLHSKSKPACSESERWFVIWAIIFPNEPPPSSPYIPTGASEDLSRFLEFAQRRAESILFQRLRANGIISSSDEEMSLSEQEIVRQGFNDVYEQWLPTFPSLAGSATSTSTSKRHRPMQHETPGSLPDSAVALGSQSQPSESQFATSSTQGERLAMEQSDTGTIPLENDTAPHRMLSSAEPIMSNTFAEFGDSLSAPAIEFGINDNGVFGDLFTHTWDEMCSYWESIPLGNAG